MFAEAGVLMILLPPIFEAPGSWSRANRVWTPMSLRGRARFPTEARALSVSERLRRLRWMRRFRMMVVQVRSQTISNDNVVPGHRRFEEVLLHVAGKVRP